MTGAIIGFILLVIIAFVAYRYLKVRRQNIELSKQRFERIKPLLERIQGGQEITERDVALYAENFLTREPTFHLLKENEKLHLFPKELLTIEKGAESNLANWLEFPTELDACPDEMEHMKQVTIPFDKENNVHFHVFKFRVNEPHWAAKDGWMLGVAGPYFDDSAPYDHPGATFSRLSKVEIISPEEEANWVFNNIAKRG